jgi:hypothetical protein
MFVRKSTRLLSVIAVAIAIGGGAYGVLSTTASSGSATTTAATSALTSSGRAMARGGGSNARSGPAAGGTSGTIASMSTSSFTLTTSAGQKVTVNQAPSTSASAMSNGGSVLVLGTVNGTTITASRMIVQPTDSGGSETSSAAAVVPFQRGAPSTSKQVGQIPANYRQGSGRIVSGKTANTATEAALAAYPGGIVDRVVKLSNGQYEVHNIGVNWPHHIFVNQSFKVIGAD